MRIAILLCAVVLLVMSSCGNRSNKTANLEFEFSGLENLGEGFTYQGWLVVNGEPVTTGNFNVDDNGNLSQSSFEVNAQDLEEASSFVVTIEPFPDNNPMPSATHILAGDFYEDRADLSIDHNAALGIDLTTAMGKFILATLSDGNENEYEDSGVWFIDNSLAFPVQGLDLPELPDGWIYEGWASINQTCISTGKFRFANESDEKNTYSNTVNSPPFPGEDFLTNSPDGFNFPVSLKDKTVLITVEPYPDNSSEPFAIQPLSKIISANQEVHSVVEMDNFYGTEFISGVIRK